jgi:hypothetical protein
MLHLNRLQIQRSVTSTVSTEQGSCKMLIEGNFFFYRLVGFQLPQKLGSKKSSAWYIIPWKSKIKIVAVATSVYTGKH